MARNLWSDRPLGVKLASLVVAGALALVAFAVLTVQGCPGRGNAPSGCSPPRRPPARRWRRT